MDRRVTSVEASIADPDGILVCSIHGRRHSRLRQQGASELPLMTAQGA